MPYVGLPHHLGLVYVLSRVHSQRAAVQMVRWFIMKDKEGEGRGEKARGLRVRG
jgi:hypothetical protein